MGKWGCTVAISLLGICVARRGIEGRLPPLAIADNEKVQVPFAAYLQGDALTYTLSSASSAHARITGSKGIDAGDTVGGVGGTPVANGLRLYDALYLTEATDEGAAVFTVLEDSVALLWSRCIAGVRGVTVSQYSKQTVAFVLGNDTDVSIVDLSTGDMDTVDIDFQGNTVDRMESYSDSTGLYLVFLLTFNQSQLISVYQYVPEAPAKQCGALVPPNPIRDMRYQQRMYVLEEVQGLMALLVGSNCEGLQLISTGNLTLGRPMLLGTGSDKYISVLTSLGAYTFQASTCTIESFLPLSSSPLSASNSQSIVTSSRSLVIELTEGRVSIVAKTIGRNYVDWFGTVDCDLCESLSVAAVDITADETLVILAVTGGLNAYSLHLSETYLEIWNATKSGNLRVTVRSLFPQPQKLALKVPLTLIPAGSIVYGSGYTASLSPQSQSANYALIDSDSISLKLPCSTYFSGVNIDSFSLEPVNPAGISFTPAVLHNPFFQPVNSVPIGEEWAGLTLACGMSADMLEFVAYDDSQLVLFGYYTDTESLGMVNTQAYAGDFGDCIGVNDDYIAVVTTAGSQSSLAVYTTDQFALNATIPLPAACSRLRKSQSYLLCIGPSEFVVCKVSLQTCVKVSAQQVIDAVSPFDIYDAEFVNDLGATVIIADGHNGVRTIDVEGLFLGANSVEFIEYIARCEAPTQLRRLGHFLYILSSTVTTYDLANYPEFRFQSSYEVPGFTLGTSFSAATNENIYACNDGLVQVLSTAVVSVTGALRTQFSLGTCNSYLFFSGENRDLVMYLRDSLLAFFAVPLAASTVLCEVTGKVVNATAIGSSDYVKMKVMAYAFAGQNYSLGEEVEVEIRSQGHYVWTDATAISLTQTLPISDSKWLDLTTFFYGKLLTLQGVPDSLEGIELVQGSMEQSVWDKTTIEECSYFARVNEEMIAALCGDALKMWKLNTSTPVFSPSISSLFPSAPNLRCLSLTSSSTQSVLVLYMSCSQWLSDSNLPLSYFLSVSISPQSFAVISTQSTPAALSAQEILLCAGGNTAFTVAFNRTNNAIVHIVSISGEGKSSAVVTSASFDGQRLDLVDAACKVSDEGLDLYLATEQLVHARFAKDLTNFTVIRTKDLNASELVSCGNSLLALADREIVVLEYDLKVKKRIYDWQEGLNTVSISCFESPLSEKAVALVANSTGVYLEMLNFRLDPISSLQVLSCCAVLESLKPLFLSELSYLYQHSPSGCIHYANFTSPLLQLSPVSSPYTGVYTITANNGQSLAGVVELIINRTDIREERKGVKSASDAGRWVWAIIGSVGVVAGVATIVVFTIKRKRKLKVRSRSLNISLQSLPDPLSS